MHQVTTSMADVKTQSELLFFLYLYSRTVGAGILARPFSFRCNMHGIVRVFVKQQFVSPLQAQEGISSEYEVS